MEDVLPLILLCLVQPYEMSSEPLVVHWRQWMVCIGSTLVVFWVAVCGVVEVTRIMCCV